MEADVRASDADRDRVADILREALAEGRLDAEEHSERLDRLYAAKTMGQLEPLVRDLPRPAGHGAPRPAAAVVEQPQGEGFDATDNVVAIFSGATRRGRWRIGRKTNAFACFGGVDIDLTEAVFEQREIVINATAIFGGVDIRLPENVTLRGRGTGIFGGFDVYSFDAPDPDAPVVVVRGAAIFGGVSAKPKRGKRVKNLHSGHGRGH
ncbi:hypothetical protein N566_04225 [Streptomycetaceae bacterium MP113-05]|nr:hypothetical protein N566_04225 [Streptomycetaceae bacterium MP113-05]